MYSGLFCSTWGNTGGCGFLQPYSYEPKNNKRGQIIKTSQSLVFTESYTNHQQIGNRLSCFNINKQYFGTVPCCDLSLCCYVSAQCFQLFKSVFWDKWFSKCSKSLIQAKSTLHSNSDIFNEQEADCYNKYEQIYVLYVSKYLSYCKSNHSVLKHWCHSVLRQK